MPEGHARLGCEFVGGFAEASRMRELKTDHEVVGLAVAFPMRRDQRCAQLGDSSLVPVLDDELIGIRSSVRAHGHRLTAINQLRTALSKSVPAANHFLGDAAGGRCVPAFHGLDGPPIADGFAIDLHLGNGLRQRRTRSRGNRVFARQIDTEGSDVVAEVVNGLQRRYADKLSRISHEDRIRTSIRREGQEAVAALMRSTHTLAVS